MLRSAKDLTGYTIRATDGEIGKVEEFLFDDQSWTVRYLVADTGGWLTGRLVLISPQALQGSDWTNEELPVSLTRARVENAPSIYEDQPVSRQYEAVYSDYYGYPYYWGAPYATVPGGFVAGAPGMAPLGSGTTAQPVQHEERGDPHLRSTKEVRGYDILARDGEIGHLDDFLIDDASWKIESVVIATRDWLPGKKVIVPPGAIREIDWPERYVEVELNRDEIKAGPEYEESMTAADSSAVESLR